MNSQWKEEKYSHYEALLARVQQKSLCFTYGFLLLIFLLCFVNLIILIIIYSVLQIQFSGMSSMSFFKENGEIKWMIDADFETISLSSSIDGFYDQDIIFQGTNQNVEFAAEDFFRSSMKVTNKGTFLKTQNFKFVDPDSEKKVLDLNGKSKYSIIGEFNAKSIETDIIRTPRIVSDDKYDLSFINSGGNISLTGNEGIYGDSKTLYANSTGDVIFNIKDNNFDLIFNGLLGGIRLNPARIPRVRMNDASISNVVKYRLCLCIKTNQLFRIEMKSDKLTCAIANENPCL
uniref:Beta-sarcoglycan n=1 Tax=Hydra vulgaris TaxID=6087 RepID=T2MCB4_HYDVU